MQSMTISEARKEFVGKKFNQEISRSLGSQGYGFTVSCKTGRIADVFMREPCRREMD